jgi:hypothetical protein
VTYNLRTLRPVGGVNAPQLGESPAFRRGEEVNYHLDIHDRTGLAETRVFSTADDEAAIGRTRGLLIAGDRSRLGYLSGDNPTDTSWRGFRTTEIRRLAFDAADAHEEVAR